MISKLETLIFVDSNHLNPFLSNILLKLSPKLKEIGYESFFDEAPSDANIEDMIKFYETHVKGAEKQVAVAEQFNQTIVSNVLKLCTDQWSETLSNELITSAREYEGTEYFVIFTSLIPLIPAIRSATIKKYGDIKLPIQIIELEKNVFQEAVLSIIMEMKVSTESKKAKVNFLKGLLTNQLKYKPIDHSEASAVCASLINAASFKSENDLNSYLKIKDSIPELIKKALEQRDTAMSNEYLHALESVFGFIGLLHLEGMQKILEQSQRDSSTKCDFIYIHSDVTVGRQPEVLQRVNAVRQGKINLPIGLTLIDATNMNEEQVIEAVLMHIQNKSANKIGQGNMDFKESYPSYKPGSPRLFLAKKDDETTATLSTSLIFNNNF
ncbi:MAG: hypothetical protein H0U57_14315 [Tatlockia sp.]|nr:hypothetical protein [Tatlockia sp.]